MCVCDTLTLFFCIRSLAQPSQLGLSMPCFAASRVMNSGWWLFSTVQVGVHGDCGMGQGRDLGRGRGRGLV